MKKRFKIETVLGKWSVGLQSFFAAAMAVAVLLVLGLGLLSFDDSWWDISVGILFPASFAATVAGVLAIFHKRERSVLVSLSTLIGVCVILFVLLHSLIISD